jgi:hypothetical protein
MLALSASLFGSSAESVRGWFLCDRSAPTSAYTLCCICHATEQAGGRPRRIRAQSLAIEQQHRELKDDLGLDHFEGQSF